MSSGTNVGGGEGRRKPVLTFLLTCVYKCSKVNNTCQHYASDTVCGS